VRESRTPATAKPWASPVTAPAPASTSRPWSQPEAVPPSQPAASADPGARPTEAAFPDETASADPDSKAPKPDRRFRRFWEKTTATDQPAAAPADVAPTEESQPNSDGVEAERPSAGSASGPGQWQNLPAHHSATPTGHLGAVPRTGLSAPLPAAIPAPAPTGLAKPVTPTTIRPATPTSKVRQTRKARLRVARIDPWSVMKTSLLFGVAGAIMMVVAVFVVFTVIDSTGLYQAVNDLVSTVLTNPDSASVFDIKTYVNTQRAVGLAALLGVLDVIIITALATVLAFLYNLAANIMGGIEITLAED
jgi:hypothetical protein